MLFHLLWYREWNCSIKAQLKSTARLLALVSILEDVIAKDIKSLCTKKVVSQDNILIKIFSYYLQHVCNEGIETAGFPNELKSYFSK